MEGISLHLSQKRKIRHWLIVFSEQGRCDIGEVEEVPLPAS